MKLLVSSHVAEVVVKDIAAKVTSWYSVPKDIPVVIGILDGAAFFLKDLVHNMPIDVEIGFVKVKSYKGTERGDISEVLDLISIPLEGRHLVIVEDIVDSGTTIDLVRKHFEAKNPASIRVVSFLLRERPENFNKVDAFGIQIQEGHFAVGYGMDHNGLGRMLKDVWSF